MRKLPLIIGSFFVIGPIFCLFAYYDSNLQKNQISISVGDWTLEGTPFIFKADVAVIGLNVTISIIMTNEETKEIPLTQ